MLSVQTLAGRIRTRLHDTDEIEYDDEQILDCINNGVRFIRRTIASIRPALLMTEHKGTLAGGAKSVELPVRPLKIINVTLGANGEFLYETEMATAIYENMYKVGDPKYFFLTGTKTINFYPIPSSNKQYTIRTVDDINELEWSDNSPLLTEFDDFLVEYVTIRLSIGNEYDVSQEGQLMANIVEQIQTILTPPPPGFVTRPYWDGRSWNSGGYR